MLFECELRVLGRQAAPTLPEARTGHLHMPPPFKVFISYSHVDKSWKDRLVVQLSVLERQGLLTVWSDGQLQAGSDWLPAIKSAMGRAQVAVFLISAAFLNSDFIREQEIPALMKRRQGEGLLVIPVIVRPCPWKQLDWLASLQVRPLEGRTLAELRKVQADAVLCRLAEEILGLAGEYKTSTDAKAPGQSPPRGVTFVPQPPPRSDDLTAENGELRARSTARVGAGPPSSPLAPVSPQIRGLPVRQEEGQGQGQERRPVEGAMPPGSILLSFASEDREAAGNLKAALEGAGLDVWVNDFDRFRVSPSAWDRLIQSNIGRCSLFIPLLSQQAARRLEGYFRREWRWALDRDQGMDPSFPFILPIVVDDLQPYASGIPLAFWERHCGRFPAARPTDDFVENVKKAVRRLRSRP